MLEPKRAGTDDVLWLGIDAISRGKTLVRDRLREFVPGKNVNIVNRIHHRARKPPGVTICTGVIIHLAHLEILPPTAHHVRSHIDEVVL